ncbi:MAG: helix-turn-helix domain-containing protein [Pseudomonas sp.]|nr:helix-turn-helix domain-containing protein [Pseudomonas sp.]
MSESSPVTDTRKMTVGGALRDARVAAGLTVSEVASKLNLTAQAIEALETNKLERLPGLTFARGYIRNYAKLLGLDAEQLAKQFDQQTGSSIESVHVQTVDQVGEARRMSRGMLQFSAFFVFLVVLGAIYYGWKTFTAVEPDTSNQSAIFERVEVERADGSVHVQTLDEPEDQAVVAALEESTEYLDLDESAETVDLEVQVDESPIESESAAKKVIEAQAITKSVAEQKIAEPLLAEVKKKVENASGIGDLQLSFENDCWLRIVDADGKEVMSGIKRAGEQLHVTGKAPLDVHLGYATGVSVLYNGEPVDISSAIRGETARIKLGQ